MTGLTRRPPSVITDALQCQRSLYRDEPAGPAVTRVCVCKHTNLTPPFMCSESMKDGERCLLALLGPIHYLCFNLEAWPLTANGAVGLKHQTQNSRSRYR